MKLEEVPRMSNKMRSSNRKCYLRQRLHVVLFVTLAFTTTCTYRVRAAPTAATIPHTSTWTLIETTETATTNNDTTTRNTVDKLGNGIKNKFVSQRTEETTSNDDNGEAKKLNTTDISIMATTEKSYDDNTTAGSRMVATTTRRPRKSTKLKRPRTSAAPKPTVKPVLSTDDYFISGLSDLLLENQAFDRIDDILTEAATTEAPQAALPSTVLSSTATTVETKLIAGDATTIVETTSVEYSSTDKLIADVGGAPLSSSLSSVDATSSPAPTTTPDLDTTHGTIATAKTIIVESFDETTQSATTTSVVEDEQLFSKLKSEEDEKLNVKAKSSNNTKKKALKPLGGGGGGGGGKGKKAKLSKKLVAVDELVDNKHLDATTQKFQTTLDSLSTTTDGNINSVDDPQITSTVHVSTTTIRATTTTEQPATVTEVTAESTTLETTTLPAASETEGTPLDSGNSSNKYVSGHDYAVTNNQNERPERANLTNINNIEIVNGDNFVKITNSSDDVVDVEITESNGNDNDGKSNGDEILFKMNVFAVEDKVAGNESANKITNATANAPTESLEIIIIEETESSSENREREKEDQRQNDDLFEVVDHGDNEKSDDSMEKPPDLIFQANVEEQKSDDDFFTTVFEEKAPVTGGGATKPPIVHFQEEIYLNHPTTIKVELPTNHQVNAHNEDEIKLKTTEKDSDTTFYISNTEVKVIESGQTPQPNANQENQFFLAPLYEEDVIIDFSSKNSSGRDLAPDKYEADIILSPLANNFDGISDINYIGESFLNIEEITTRPPQSGVILNEKYSDGVATSSSSSSDIIIEPVLIPEVALSMAGPMIEAMPPQIELGEMIFNESEDEEYVLNGGGDVGGGNPFFINDNRSRPNQKKKKKLKPKPVAKKDRHFGAVVSKLIKSPLAADLPRNASAMSKEEKMIAVGKLANSTGQSDNYTNATAFLIDDDDSDNGCSELQTLFLACFATLTPLIMSVLIAFGVRYFWKKHRRQCGLGNGMVGDNSTDPLAAKSQNGSADELKSMESGLTIDRSDENLNTDLATNNPNNNQSNNHSGANGSVITMTLKNNHLIVETEERNDISRDTRETKVHYSPSEKDGVFIVESSRGADQAGSFSPKPIGSSNYPQSTQKASSTVTPNGPVDTIIEEQRPSQQEVQVHTPPGGGSAQPRCANSNTGLSQSDLSLSSSNGSNQNYNYGNQEPYSVDVKGYSGSSPIQRTRIISLSGTSEMKPLMEQASPEQTDPNRPIIKAALLKSESQDLVQDHVMNAFVEGGQALSSDIDAFNNNNTDTEKLIQKAHPTKLANGVVHNGIVSNGDGGNTLENLTFLPEPPTSDEIKQLNDLTSLDLNQLDSLPPPSPPPHDPTSAVVAAPATAVVATTANGVLES